MAKKPTSKPAKKPAQRIVQTLNVHNPGKTYPRDAGKYEAARKAFLKLLPKSGPGLTQSEMMAAMKKTLPASQFGTASGWWTKTVQLTLRRAAKSLATAASRYAGSSRSKLGP